MSKEYKTKNYDPEKSREYYRKNSEYIIQRVKEYARMHAVERSIYFQEHYRRNKERISERCREYNRSRKKSKPPEASIEIKPAVVAIQKNIIIIFD